MKRDELKSYEQELSKTYELENIIRYESDKEENLLFAIDTKKGVFIFNHEIHPFDWINSVEYLTISDQVNGSKVNRDIALAGLFTGGFFTTGAGIVTMGSKGPTASDDCEEGRLIRGLVIRPKDKKENQITLFANEGFCKAIFQCLNYR